MKRLGVKPEDDGVYYGSATGPKPAGASKLQLKGNGEDRRGMGTLFPSEEIFGHWRREAGRS